MVEGTEHNLHKMADSVMEVDYKMEGRTMRRSFVAMVKDVVEPICFQQC